LYAEMGTTFAAFALTVWIESASATACPAQPNSTADLFMKGTMRTVGRAGVLAESALAMNAARAWGPACMGTTRRIARGFLQARDIAERNARERRRSFFGVGRFTVQQRRKQMSRRKRILATTLAFGLSGGLSISAFAKDNPRGTNQDPPVSKQEIKSDDRTAI